MIKIIIACNGTIITCLHSFSAFQVCLSKHITYNYFQCFFTLSEHEQQLRMLPSVLDSNSYSIVIKFGEFFILMCESIFQSVNFNFKFAAFLFYVIQLHQSFLLGSFFELTLWNINFVIKARISVTVRAPSEWPLLLVLLMMK